MSNCTKTKSCKHRSWYSNANWIPAIIIAILPKCPFCIMAYSGAVTLCSGTTMYPNASGKTPILIVVLSLVVLGGLIFNYKNRKTIYAIAIAITGIVTMLMSQYYFMNATSYYLGAGFMFFGIWYNGSFQYFLNKLSWKKHFTKSQINI